MKTILDKIIAEKRIEVQKIKEKFTYKELESSLFFQLSTSSLVKKLKQSDFGIIAEIKRKSPSAGNINISIEPIEIAKKYEELGVAGISVLTDFTFFGGSNSDLIKVKQNTSIPILRKDFIIDEIQIFQAKSIGADVILLIAEALSEQEILHFTILAQELGMEVICEFHEKHQLSKINDFVDVIGVNNRNLKSQNTSLQTSIDVIDYLPKDRIIISESGIKSKQELIDLKNIGYHGALIGESILKNDSVEEQLKSFVSTQEPLLIQR